MIPPTSRYSTLGRAGLARVVPELLLVGHLIDRSAMPWCIAEFGRDEMARIAIEEWASASPIYTRRMQRALGYAPGEPGRGDVVTIFKGLQLDIGAPPQFMDFRFSVHDSWHGEFHLAHCGALMDVEPMGDGFVRAMCHDIEDPTFDATAVASNPRARVRPVHRPPRVPADRQPHCAWTVTIDESHPAAQGIPALAVNERSRAATLELAPIVASGDGLDDYSGPLVSDLDFTCFSHSALSRIADEVCLQMHLLDLGFANAVADRARTVDDLVRIRRKQLTGIAGLAAQRLIPALDLPRDPDQLPRSALRLLALHPVLNPSAYVTATIADDSIVVKPSPAHHDGAWVSLCGPAWSAPLQAAVQALDRHLDVEVTACPEAGRGAWRATVTRRAEPGPEAEEVAVASFSTGATFRFETRRPLPIAPSPTQ